MLVTDAPIHLREINRSVLWPMSLLTGPQREGGFSADQAIEEIDATGVDRTVVVPPTFVGEMNDSSIEAVERYPDRFAVMDRCDQTTPNPENQIAQWLEQPHMLGIRLTFFSLPTSGRLGGSRREARR